MGHVSGKFLEDCFQILRQNSIDLDAILEGLPFDPADLHSANPVIDWNLFVEFLVRLEAYVGGPEGLERLGENITDMSMAPVLRRLAGFAASPETLYSSGERWALKRYLPIIESRQDVLEDGRITIIARIPGQHRPCPQIFHLGTGALRAMPRILSLPPAEVISDIRARWGEWIITPPPSRSILTRIHQAARVLFSARAAIEQLGTQQHQLEEGYRKLQGAHAELQENEARFRALAESAVDLIIEIAPDGVFRYVSPSADELLGIDAEEAIGTNLMSWLHPEDGEILSQFLSDCFGLKPRWAERPTFQVRHQNGSWVWMEMEARLYKTRTGENCAVAILRDVSQRVELEEHDRRYRENLESRVAERTMELERKNQELRQLQSLLLDAERLGTARDLAGRVAHSINNPLGALIGEITMMINEAEQPSEQLDNLLELTSRVGQVVRRTLELYREGKINRAPESLEGMFTTLGEGIARRAEANRVRVEMVTDPDLPTLQVDRPLLLAALESMGNNALDWMPEGGELQVDGALDPTGNHVRIRVSDNGPGVPDENKQKIFEPFFTTNPKGTGLGLAIAKGVVVGHEGEIHVEDRAGGGATFIIDLPLFP